MRPGIMAIFEIWDLGPDPFWTLGPGIMAFLELGPGPRPLFEPGTWDLGYLEGGLSLERSSRVALDTHNIIGRRGIQVYISRLDV